MDLEKLEALFVETLADHRFSRGERRALREVLAELDLPPHERLGLVGRAFALAQRELGSQGPDVGDVLGWLEGLVRVLFPTDAPRLGEAIFAPQEDCALRLRRLLEAARASVEVCVFTITDDRLTHALLDAHDRGVAVRIVTDDEKFGDPGSDVVRLQGTGIPIRVDRSDDHMHHKFALFDRRILVTGSYNWTRSAAERNHENVTVTDDPRLVTAFAGEFDRLWASFAAPGPA